MMGACGSQTRWLDTPGLRLRNGHVPRSPRQSKSAPRITPRVASAGSLIRWEQELVRRRHAQFERPAFEGEFSVRLEHDRVAAYFPLGSAEPAVAAARADEIHRRLKSEGWERTLAIHPHEFTLALFWLHRPSACTYTTLFTLPDSEPTSDAIPGNQSPNSIRTAIVEPQKAVRRALEGWVNRTRGFRCVLACASEREALARLPKVECDLLLFNRGGREVAEGDLLERLQQRHPRLPAFDYGIYAESDDIFVSMTGVEEGYLLRRRPPAEALSPLRAAALRGGSNVRELRSNLLHHFADLFLASPERPKSVNEVVLTPREREIIHCLRSGQPDKEVARILRISPLTVHTHLKRIFGKLGVHTRTEAVMKYWQK